MAAGLIFPDAGRVVVMGHEDRRRGMDWSCVGYMFQDDRLLPWRSGGRSNVALALEAGAMPASERRRRARRRSIWWGSAVSSSAYPHQLSGGMRSRVALGAQPRRRAADLC